MKIQAFKGTIKVYQFTWCKRKHNIWHRNKVCCYSCPLGTQWQHSDLGEMTLKSKELIDVTNKVDEKKRERTRLYSRRRKNPLLHKNKKVEEKGEKEQLRIWINLLLKEFAKFRTREYYQNDSINWCSKYSKTEMKLIWISLNELLWTFILVELARQSVNFETS